MVFVLGVERSATTWVTNILDMHPATELYMEPLSMNISRFSDWPDRFVKIENQAERARIFLEEFESLKKRKKLFFTRFTNSNWAWDTDMRIGQKFWDVSSRARDFFELNFHRFGEQGYPEKQQNPMIVIKELRLNFNASLIKKIDPEAKVIVVLRNYAANVKSILNQLKQGNLTELSFLLNDRYGDTDLESIFDYWSGSFNTLLTDLDNEGIDYLLLKQEDLIKTGKAAVGQLFNFIGLEATLPVYNYLAASNAPGSGKHSTNRDHAALLEENRNAEKELYPLLAKQIERIEWHHLLREDIIKSGEHPDD